MRLTVVPVTSEQLLVQSVADSFSRMSANSYRMKEYQKVLAVRLGRYSGYRITEDGADRVRAAVISNRQSIQSHIEHVFDKDWNYGRKAVLGEDLSYFVQAKR